MFPGYDRIVEERIRKAREAGEFDNLPGKGKPLEFFNEPIVPPELRLAYKILKNADYLPPEIELKKEIRKAEDLLAAEVDTVRKYKLLKKINFMIMKLNTIRNASIGSEMPQYYMDRLIQKLDPED